MSQGSSLRPDSVQYNSTTSLNFYRLLLSTRTVRAAEALQLLRCWDHRVEVAPHLQSDHIVLTSVKNTFSPPPLCRWNEPTRQTHRCLGPRKSLKSSSLGADLTAAHSCSWCHEDSRHNMPHHPARGSWQADGETRKSLRFNPTGAELRAVFFFFSSDSDQPAGPTRGRRVGDKRPQSNLETCSTLTPKQTSLCLQLSAGRAIETHWTNWIKSKRPSESLWHIHTLNRPLSHSRYFLIDSDSIGSLDWTYLLQELTAGFYVHPRAKPFLSFQVITRINSYIHKQNLKFLQCPPRRPLASQLKPNSAAFSLQEVRRKQDFLFHLRWSSHNLHNPSGFEFVCGRLCGVETSSFRASYCEQCRRQMWRHYIWLISFNVSSVCDIFLMF